MEKVLSLGVLFLILRKVFNMKRFLITTTLILFFLIPNLTLAQTPAQNDETETGSSNTINQIKEKVTDKVEKLNLVEKRGIVGVVESVNNDQIRLNDLNDKIRIIEVDELTKYSSDETNAFDLTDIEKGVNISAIGLYNKDSGKLLARFLNEISIPVFLNGVISEKNDDDFTITLVTEDEKNYTVDVENITKSFAFEDEGLAQSGFSNLKILQNAIITGYPDPEDENKITATRIIIFPEIPQNPRINVEIPESTDEVTPTP